MIIKSESYVGISVNTTLQEMRFKMINVLYHPNTVTGTLTKKALPLVYKNIHDNLHIKFNMWNFVYFKKYS